MLPERDYQRIYEVLNAQPPSVERIIELLDKARSLQGLSFTEAGELLKVTDEELREKIIFSAGKVKNAIYGNRVVMFAPLYLSNECTNNCLYCGFRQDNKNIERRTLSVEEAVDEAQRIETMGHKRILLVCGEAPGQNGVKYVFNGINEIYKNMDIRRLNINMAPLKTEEFRILKEAGIGTYQLFQETYHPGKYSFYHPSGPKSDYEWRFSAVERAIQAGIDDIGMGVLFGLYEYKFEVMALICHAEMLERKCGVGPHTISVPRLKRAPGSAVYDTGYHIDNSELKLAIAVLRLSIPYTGIILSTRESAELRNSLLDIGVSQISAGSCTSPGGYGCDKNAGQQFNLEDNRTLEEAVRDICRQGYLPSFCTACYRKERTGEKFMNIVKAGEIKNLCQPNAIITFKEYLCNYACPDTLREGELCISKSLDCKEVGNRKNEIMQRLGEIESGQRDIYY